MRKRVVPLDRCHLDYLEEVIRKSKIADQESQRVMIWLLRRSEGLTKSVRLISPKNDVLGKKVAVGAHAMCSKAMKHPERLNAVVVACQYDRKRSLKEKPMRFVHGSAPRVEGGFSFYVGLQFEGEKPEILEWNPHEFAKV